MKLGSFSYASSNVPRGYECATCGATDCKLWREYNTFMSCNELTCCDCAAKSQNKDISSMREDGKYGWNGYYTDQIGFRVPAVPTEDGESCWGYTSVPDEGVAWWKALPLREAKP